MSFTLYPAIDLKAGQCVRLIRGDMDQATVFSSSPAEQAASFEAKGFEYLHVVDLDGAFSGQSENRHSVEAILQSVSMPVQLGGGIRTREHVEIWLEAGISRLILGTIALKSPEFVKACAKAFPNKIAVGIDALNGMVAVEGWADVSDMPALDLARAFEDSGVAAIIFTDIGRDGLKTGVNREMTEKLAETVSIPVIASGGMSSVQDVEALARSSSGVSGAILGRALYDGDIDAEAALKVAKC